MNFRLNPVLLLFCLIPVGIAAQAPTFELSGTIAGVESGQLKMWQSRSDSTFYAFQSEIPVIDGHFQIQGHLAFPRLTALAVFDKDGNLLLETPWFYVDPGQYTLQIRTDPDGRVQLNSNAPAFREYAEYFEPMVEKLETQQSAIEQALTDTPYSRARDSLLQLQQDWRRSAGQFLVSYATEHPTSYVALTEIYAAVSPENFIYCARALAALDPALQQSIRGRQVSQQLYTLKLLEKGRKFPDFELRDTSGYRTTLHRIQSSKFTLVDFWFHNCSFCIEQFPKLKALHEKYQSQGFEIIAITVDPERYEPAWKAAIVSYDLPWSQYWDVNGIQCKRYLIDNFPTSFLLNEAGEIMGRNLDMKQLEEVLRGGL